MVNPHAPGGQTPPLNDFFYLYNDNSALVVDRRRHFQLGVSQRLVRQRKTAVLVGIGCADQAGVQRKGMIKQRFLFSSLDQGYNFPPLHSGPLVGPTALLPGIGVGSQCHRQ